MESGNKHHQLSKAGVLIALGIIYGDIGTSPIYTLKFIVGDRPISEELVLEGCPASSGPLRLSRLLNTSTSL
jgi:KUP system potassium uptake protein